MIHNPCVQHGKTLRKGLAMKKWLVGLAVLLVLWLGIGIFDYARVKDFEKPVFCLLTQAADDGGSGCYRGLGYRFEIKGKFMPEDEYPGVTKYAYYIFGQHIYTGIRD